MPILLKEQRRGGGLLRQQIYVTYQDKEADCRDSFQIEDNHLLTPIQICSPLTKGTAVYETLLTRLGRGRLEKSDVANYMHLI